MSKDIAKSESAIMDFVGQVAGVGADGFENIDKKLIKLPFIKIAQALSPQVQKGPGQIQGLELGQCFNSITKKVYGSKLLVIPLHLNQSFIEWEGEGNNSKYIARFTKKEFETLVKSGEFVTLDGYRYNRNSNGNSVNETHTMCAFLPDYPTDGMVLLSFSKFSLKHIGKWITMARAMNWVLPDGRSVRAPLYGCIWSLSTMSVQGAKGTFYAFGDKKVMTAEHVGNLIDEKYQPLQQTVLDFAKFAIAKDNELDVFEKDVTPIDEEMVEVK
jgi:hypothetical protein